MLSLFHLVLKPLEVSWPNLLKETPLSLLKNNKFLQPTPITNLVSWSKSMKEKDNLLKTTTYSVNSILTEFHQLQEELHKLKSLSMLMPTVLWILLLPIKVVEKLIISLSPTKKVDSVKTILKNSSKKLNNSKLKTTLSRKRSKLKMDSNTTATPSNKLLTMKNSKANSTTNKKRPSEEKLMKSSNGWKTMLTLNSKNTKPNKKNSKLFGTQSCKKSTLVCLKDKVECQVECQEECQVECQVVCQVECLTWAVWVECQTWEEWEVKLIQNQLELMMLTDQSNLKIFICI